MAPNTDSKGNRNVAGQELHHQVAEHERDLEDDNTLLAITQETLVLPKMKAIKMITTYSCEQQIMNR